MPNVYRIRTNFGGVSGTPYISTQFFEAIGSVGQTGADEAASKVAAFWTALSAKIATAVTATLDTTCDVLEELSGDLVDSFVVSGAITQPVDASDPLPPANQGLVRLLTGQIRNSVRVAGRINIPEPTEGSSTGGVPTATYRADLVTAANGLISTPTAAALAVWHRPVRDVNGVLIRNGEAIVVNAVTSADFWAILRSRRD